MKKLLVTLRIVLCSILVFSFMVPVQATDEEFGSNLSEMDREKIMEFLSYETPSGMTNGELFHLPIYENGEYEGGIEPLFVDICQNSNGTGENIYEILELFFSFEVGGCILGSPDFYGTLDMSGTSIYHMNGINQHHHVDSFIMDNCPNLERFCFGGQYTTEVSAVNCPNLEYISGHVYDILRHLEIQPGAYESPVEITVIGEGGILMFDYDVRESNECFIQSQCGFIGGLNRWYSNGELISTSSSISVDSGCSLILCFAGDVDEDRDITVADATLIMRNAIFGGGEDRIQQQDTDCNGVIDMIDAVTIARIALGLY